jgi:L-arabinose transport system permease protein
MSDALRPTVGRRVVRGLRQNAAVLMVLAAVLLLLWRFVPDFYTKVNLLGLALSVSTVGMVACTMLFCLASGDFDLSVETVAAAAGVLAATMANVTGSVAAGMVLGVLGGGVVGLANGVLIAYVGINALIATLATMQIVRGAGFIVSHGSAVGVPHGGFSAFGTSTLLGIPAPVWLTAGCFLVFGLLLTKTTFGANTLAIGGNREAARLAGVPVKRIKTIIFTLQGLMAGFGGVVLASRMSSGQPKCLEGFSLDVISACVLGGVSLSGGVGTMHGVIIGVLIMGAVQNVMNLENVSTYYQYVARGVILLAAVMFDLYRRRRAAARA